MNSCPLKPQKPFPFRDAERLAPERKFSVPPSICRLFGLCGPAHISRLIVAIVIRIAINGVFGGWARANMSKESLEAALAKPPSGLHMHPRVMFWSTAPSVRSEPGSMQTPARLRYSACQTVRTDGDCRPTVADAVVVVFRLIAVITTCGDKFPEARSSGYNFGLTRHVLVSIKNVLARFGRLLTQLSEPLLFYHDSPITEAKGGADVNRQNARQRMIDAREETAPYRMALSDESDRINWLGRDTQRFDAVRALMASEGLTIREAIDLLRTQGR